MLFVIVVALLLVFLDWYINPTEASDKKDLILATAQILAGTALLSGLYFTWRSLQVNREGQITERFTRAIDQLGVDKLEVRIGGIYALEKIAEDSDDVYHWSIIRILTAYVRTNAPWPTKKGPESSPDSHHEDYLKAGEERSHQHKQLDIQAILYIIRDLRDRKHHDDNGEVDFIRLTDTDLRNADLRDIHLERVRLRSSNLQGANLKRARLCRARLRNVNFEGANLKETVLYDADLEQAILRGADLHRADLRKADLEDADLSDAKGVTQEQLDSCKTLKGATMPDGSKHP